MGFATHLGPWLLGTVKNTTGTTAGTIQNLGSTIVSQTKTATFADTSATTLAVLPAGACITSVQLIIDGVVFNGTSPIMTIKNGSTTIGTVTITSATGGQYAMTATTTVADAAKITNVGSTDAIITYTVSGTTVTTGSGTLIIAYIVRGSDGVMYPTSQQN
jgi:hypothetical protein